jgi:NADPH-dependent 2,4-dienoyl-CoA reductase/sulfur reductase-like enzyme
LDPDSVRITDWSRGRAYPGALPITVKLIFERGSGRVLGAQIIGKEGAAKRIDTVAAALAGRMTVVDLEGIDMSYAPPFSPVWDPVLIAAQQAVKKLGRPGARGG